VAPGDGVRAESGAQELYSRHPVAPPLAQDVETKNRKMPYQTMDVVILSRTTDCSAQYRAKNLDCFPKPFAGASTRHKLAGEFFRGRAGASQLAYALKSVRCRVRYGT